MDDLVHHHGYNHGCTLVIWKQVKCEKRKGGEMDELQYFEKCVEGVGKHKKEKAF